MKKFPKKKSIMEKSLGRKVLTVMSQTFPLKSFELRMSFLVLNMSLNKAAAFISDLSDRGLKIELEKKVVFGLHGTSVHPSGPGSNV